MSYEPGGLATEPALSRRSVSGVPGPIPPNRFGRRNHDSSRTPSFGAGNGLRFCCRAGYMWLPGNSKPMPRKRVRTAGYAYLSGYTLSGRTGPSIRSGRQRIARFRMAARIVSGSRVCVKESKVNPVVTPLTFRVALDPSFATTPPPALVSNGGA